MALGEKQAMTCETQLTMLVEDLARNVSAGKQTDLKLLDFSKAFDKINHSKLLWKLHQYGIKGTAICWIHAFLGNRSQTAVLDGEESGSVPVTSVVPEGSVLGPILFLVYINALPSELSSQVRLFADDSRVPDSWSDGRWKSATNRPEQTKWEKRWGMEFNPSMCHMVRVTTARDTINTVYILHGQVLDVVTKAG